MMCKAFTVKQQIIFSALLAAAGAVCFLVAWLAPVDEHAKGVLCGAGTAVVLIGLVRSIQLWRLSRDPERVREYELSQNEERTAFIMNQAMRVTLLISLLVEYAAGLIFSMLGQQPLGVALCYLVVGQVGLLFFLKAVYQKKY